MREMLRKARAGKYGIAAPSIHNEDTARTAIQVAADYHAPMILDLGFQENPIIY